MDAFDADVIIYAAVPGHPLGRRVRSLFPAAPPGKSPGSLGRAGVGSVLLLPEVLAKPLRDGQAEAVTALGALLARLDLRPADRATAELATVLAARYGLSAADALHLATAVAMGAKRFITNNRRDFGPGITEIDVTYPDDLPDAALRGLPTRHFCGQPRFSGQSTTGTLNVIEASRNASDWSGGHGRAVIMSTAGASVAPETLTPATVAPGTWLRRQRKAAGLTQEDLAERSGVSVRTIADLERGRTRKPYPSSLRALVRALGMPEGAGTALVARYRLVDGDAAASAPIPRQLPTAVTHFAGRAAELAELDRQLAVLDNDDSNQAGTVVITAIGGTAGVGKTALALHWAHRAAAKFPDGQLYANLRGFDTASQPADAADILRGFLDALGVHPAHHPATLEALAARYRSLLTGRRALILLDNASDIAQVRPLLPASPQCLVIVTSRRELTALAASEGARLISLDVLTGPEATELLTARLGPDRVSREPQAVRDLAQLCARLPLALSVVVARAAAQPRLSLTGLAGELTELAGRLDALDAGDPTANVRTVISLSYQHLSEPAALMFRLLGLHPGPDITAPAATSLAAVTPGQARTALRELARASLITEHVPGRYAFHDLLRSYAHEQAYGTIPHSERHVAIIRSLDHYLQSAHAARGLLYPGHDTIKLEPPLPGVRAECFATKQAALAWLDAEYEVLLKEIGVSVRESADDYAWRFPVVLWTYYYVCGHWHDGVATQRVAVEAARRRGERNGFARAMRGLGGALAQLGEYGEAQDLLQRAGELFREIGDGVGLARTHVVMSQVHDYQGQYAESLRVADEALRIADGAPDDPDMQLVRAAALNNSAWCRIPFGELEPARDRCLEAISLCRSLGYTPGEAGTWDTLGYVYQHLGDYAEAVRCFRTALQLGEASGNRLLLANTLGHLAETHALAGDLSAARAAWQRALDVYDDLRHRDGAKVRAKIRELDALSVRPAPGYLAGYRPAYASGGVRRLLRMVPLRSRQHPGLQRAERSIEGKRRCATRGPKLNVSQMGSRSS